MPTPYEEISKNYGSRAAVKTDANLSQDTLQLGGLDANEYATKEYVKKADDNNLRAGKNYTDEEIRKIKEELKGYTDTAIDNVDLTFLASKADVEALQEKCKNSCATTLNSAIEHTNNIAEELKENCKENCDNSLKNAKAYTDNAIIDVNKNVKNLFQSVSDGKQKIAEAITDKGVSTSANDSFDVMSNNIKKIETETLDTSDATASESKILRGYTAYVNGKKIVGSHVETVIPGVPTVGTNTEDGTATSADIRLGKIAYSNGQRLIGTLNPNTITNLDGTVTNTEIEEIHKLSNEDYTSSIITNLKSSLDLENEDAIKILHMDIKVLSNGNAYIVRNVEESSGYKYIYSNQIYNSKIVRQATASDNPDEPIYKKFRYSYEELRNKRKYS